jgi:hypothetical protein
MGILKIPYSRPIPESTIRKIANARLRIVGDRNDERFW